MSFSAFDHACMTRALRLARRGLYSTTPNPRVGCVLAQQGQVVAEGWHLRAGEPHAEIHALREAGAAAAGATAYVTLEPCSHQGRTGPCAQALIDAGVGAVIVATRDPNPRVAGQGIAMLRAAGIETCEGLLSDEARALNVGFFSRMLRGRPWVRVKLAQSLDGRTALKDGSSAWITGTAARQDVQRWRARACAVLTGLGTVQRDNPSLNVRLPRVQRQPLRVIADSRWQTPAAARTLHLPGATLVAGRADVPVPAALEAVTECLPLASDGGRVDLAALLEALADRELNEVHVEAGAGLAGALLEARLMDELLLYQAPVVLGSDALPTLAIKGPSQMQDRQHFALEEQVMVGEDLRIRLRPQYCED